jgi:glycine/D-amino acid oxidase-like deaminating enzyme/nitrite reductase/ring-hydroxylating ferredoxin subunit
MPSGTNCVPPANESGLWQRESDIKICFLMGKAYRDSATFWMGQTPHWYRKIRQHILIRTFMNDHAGKSISVWMATATLPPFSILAKNEHADVCIVGAGIAGLTTAYLLGRAGHSVIVLDDGPIVSGETERTTAHLVTALDDRYFELERFHGKKGARLAAESHAAAIDQIERIVREEKIACDFERVDGYLFVPPDESTEILEIELAAAQRASLTDLEIIARAPLGSFDTGKALRFPRQGQFHPLKYLAALAQAIIRDGGRIYTETHATKIEGGEPARIETRGGAMVTADAVVVATNTPVNDLLAIHTKQAAYRTFVIGAGVPAGSVHKALYWDTPDPYHYMRLQSLPKTQLSSSASDLLIVGGEDHKTGQADDAEARYSRLEQWARTRFPMIAEVKFRWSGQVMEPIDGMAFIGRNPMDKKNVFVATGFSGNGMTYGTIAGMLLTDLIQGRENVWEDLYAPSRMTLRAAKSFAKETINMAAQYGNWATKGDVKRDVLVPPNTGAVVRRGLHKIAVYCDTDGQRHECSAVCPHLGGIVAWNHSEQTWDCPCHGSRFDKFGKVLDGPAITNLAPAQEPPVK